VSLFAATTTTKQAACSLPKNKIKLLAPIRSGWKTKSMPFCVSKLNLFSPDNKAARYFV
jgi:hypothetical protein